MRFARRQPHLRTAVEQLVAERRLGHERTTLGDDAREPPAPVAQEHTVERVGRAGAPPHRIQPGAVERAIVAAGGLYEKRATGAALLELIGVGRASLAQVTGLVAAQVNPTRGLGRDAVTDRRQQLLDAASGRQPQAHPTVVKRRVRQMVVSVDETRQQRAPTQIVDRSALAHRGAHLAERPHGLDPSCAGPDRFGDWALRVHRQDQRSGEDLHVHLPDRMPAPTPTGGRQRSSAARAATRAGHTAGRASRAGHTVGPGVTIAVRRRRGGCCVGRGRAGAGMRGGCT